MIIPFNTFAYASDNLIDSDLRNWENFDPSTCVVGTFFGFYRLYFVRHELASTGSYVRDGLIYDLTSLKAGNSYTLSFYLPSAEQVRNASNGQWSTTDATYYDPFVRLDATLYIGLRDEATGELYEDVSFIINKDNYLEYFGNELELTFEMPNAKNPSIVIYYFDINSSGNNVSLFFDDFLLIDNDSAKEDNFFSRLFEWFENKFKQLFNVLLYLDPDGEADYNNPFAPSDNDVNGADNLEHLQNGINKFVDSVENLTLYLRVPSEMLTTLGERFPIIPIIVVFTLVGLVVMRLFGVRRDS